MNRDYIALNDYNLINFTKDNSEIVEKIKKHATRNCRRNIVRSYITDSFNSFDFGFAYYRTEIIKKTNERKIRPCAFACIRYYKDDKKNDRTITLQLLCAIKTHDKLGAKLLNEVINHAINNNYKNIVLECNEYNTTFYKPFGFEIELIIDEETIMMTKKL